VQGFCVSISISQRLFLALFEAQKVTKLFSSKASSHIQQALIEDFRGDRLVITAENQDQISSLSLFCRYFRPH
jgi:hypothetical protein